MKQKNRVYLREGDEHIGPFRGRADADRFLRLMELYGGGSQGIEIVEQHSPGHVNSEEPGVSHWNSDRTRTKPRLFHRTGGLQS